MAERNARLPGNHRIEFCIVINGGDIVFDDSDMFGDGVNVVAVLSALLNPEPRAKGSPARGSRARGY